MTNKLPCSIVDRPLLKLPVAPAGEALYRPIARDWGVSFFKPQPLKGARGLRNTDGVL